MENESTRPLFRVGDSKELKMLISAEKVENFSRITGDLNPIHLDRIFASRTIYGEKIAHGNLVIGFMTGMIATQIPGPGSILLSQDIRFLNAIKIGEEVKLQLQIVRIVSRARLFYLKGLCTNDQEKPYIKAEFKVHLLEIESIND